MPNHITTVCTVTGEEADVAAFVAAHIREHEKRSDRQVFDFETIIPPPQSIKDTYRPMPGQPNPEGLPESCGDGQVEMYAQCLINYRKARHAYVGYSWLPSNVVTWGQLREWLDANSPSAQFWGKRMLLAAADTGYPGWYEWNVANWGTKWDAYQYKERSREPGTFIFQFQTAWNVPVPIFRKLGTMYPKLVFSVVAIDEGGPEYEGTVRGELCAIHGTTPDRERHKIVYGQYPDPPEEDDEESKEA